MWNENRSIEILFKVKTTIIGIYNPDEEPSMVRIAMIETNKTDYYYLLREAFKTKKR